MTNPIYKKSLFGKCVIRIVSHDWSPVSEIHVGIIETFPLFSSPKMRRQLREDRLREKSFQKFCFSLVRREIVVTTLHFHRMMKKCVPIERTAIIKLRFLKIILCSRIGKGMLIDINFR